MTINFPKRNNSSEELADLLSRRRLVPDDKEVNNLYETMNKYKNGKILQETNPALEKSI